MVVGKLLSFWKGLFSGAMLGFGRVIFFGGDDLKNNKKLEHYYIGGGFKHFLFSSLFGEDDPI